MQTSKMPIGVTKLKRRYHRLQIICMLLLAFSIGSAIGGVNRKVSEAKSYRKGFADGIDTATAIVKRWSPDTSVAKSVEYFINHSEIK